MTIIDKVAWIRLENGAILSSRSRGKDVYDIPDGKREPGEGDIDTFVREIQEEPPRAGAWCSVWPGRSGGNLSVARERTLSFLGPATTRRIVLTLARLVIHGRLTPAPVRRCCSSRVPRRE